MLVEPNEPIKFHLTNEIELLIDENHEMEAFFEI
jgi:hypothetical protein